MVLGENGIFSKAKKAKEETIRKEAREAVELVLLSARTQYTVSPEGMNLKEYVERENRNIEVEQTGDGTVLDRWTFTYKEQYEFGIYDLKIDNEGPTSKAMRITYVPEGYAFINSTGKKVTITLNIEILDNSLNGKPITVTTNPNVGTGTLIGNTYKLELTTDGSTNYNGEYTFEVTIGTETASKTVNVDRFLEDPVIVFPEANKKWNQFKIQVKQNNNDQDSYPSGVTYKYTVTGTNVTITNQESQKAEYDVTNTSAETTYNVSVRVQITNEIYKDVTSPVTTPEKLYEISTINDLEAIGTDASTLAESYILTRSLDFRNPESYANGVNDERYIYYTADENSDGKPDNSWTPLGSFSGTFDGKYYTINNLYIYDNTGNEFSRDV